MSSEFKHSPITADQMGSTVILPAPGAGLRYKVFSYLVLVDGQVDLVWKGGAVPLSGTMPLTGNGLGAAHNAAGHLVTPENEPLAIDLSQAVRLGGHLTYWVESI